MQINKYIYKIYASDGIHIEKFSVIFEDPNCVHIKVHGTKEIETIYLQSVETSPSTLMEAIKEICKQRALYSYQEPLYILSTPTHQITREEIAEAKKVSREILKKEQMEKCLKEADLTRSKKYLSKYKFVYQVQKTLKGIEIKKFPIAYISKYYVYFKPETFLYTQRFSLKDWNCYVEDNLVLSLAKAIKEVEKDTSTIYVLGMYDKEYTISEIKKIQEENYRKEKIAKVQKL